MTSRGDEFEADGAWAIRDSGIMDDPMDASF
jgi:hypothetical protein